MGRPTDEKKDRTIKLRISEELYADLITRGPNMSETIRKILKGENKTAVDSVPQNEITKIVEDMDEMAGCCGVPLEDMVHQFFGMLEDGRLSFENGVMRANCEPWVEEFKSVCHDLCIPVEKAAEGAIKALKRGGL